jgi:hypothetical protein
LLIDERKRATLDAFQSKAYEAVRALSPRQLLDTAWTQFPTQDIFSTLFLTGKALWLNENILVPWIGLFALLLATISVGSLLWRSYKKIWLGRIWLGHRTLIPMKGVNNVVIHLWMGPIPVTFREDETAETAYVTRFYLFVVKSIVARFASGLLVKIVATVLKIVIFLVSVFAIFVVFPLAIAIGIPLLGSTFILIIQLVMKAALFLLHGYVAGVQLFAGIGASGMIAFHCVIQPGEHSLAHWLVEREKVLLKKIARRRPRPT